MTDKTSTIFKKLERLEKDFQKLKIETFFSLPKKKLKSIYPEKPLRKAIRATRKAIWQEKYAKKV